MTETKSRRMLRHELIRLLTGLDFYRAWRLSMLKRQRTGIPEVNLVNEIVMPGSTFLELFDASPDRASVAILNEVRVWYSHASSELNHLASLGSEDRIEVYRFLDAFRKDVGFSFHTEDGTLRKLADRILKSGKVQSEDEYQIFSEIRNDLSQTVLSVEELASISAMLRAFENGPEAG